jgi:hypothetical protein
MMAFAACTGSTQICVQGSAATAGLPCMLGAVIIFTMVVATKRFGCRVVQMRGG